MRRFPENKAFAFTIFDDTDLSTVDNIAPVYRFLSELGIRTTKSVWPLTSVPNARFGGSSLQDRTYLNFVLELKNGGFEIALHNVRNFDATRELVHRGMLDFRRLIGEYPRIHANHSFNRENIYWGASRLSRSTSRLCYNLATQFRLNSIFRGHVQDSIYFWGDLCKQHISYVRNFAFNEINLNRVNPTLPYHDPSKPFVNFWFSSCDGANVEQFCKLLCEANQDRLEAEGGICIMYTHFALGFYKDDVLHPRFEALMRRLAGKNGWFVPVSELLDALREGKHDSVIPSAELMAMESRWLLQKMRTGRS